MSDNCDDAPPTTQSKSPIFVGWVPGSENTPRKSAPRLHHKKSRTGCQKCRDRRVKCDEVHPVCGSCSRHQTTCVWGRPGDSETASHSDSSKGKVSETKPKTGPRIPLRIQDGFDLSESSDRRILELRLLHQWTADTVNTINFKTDPNIPVWATAVPRLAFKHNALLYALYTLAALHIAKLEPNNIEHVATYQKYFGLTLREHRNDVTNLGPANADAATLTCTLLRTCNFALLQERSQNPYTPPMEWLRMANSTGLGMTVVAWQYIHNDENSISRGFITNAPGIDPNPTGWLRDDKALFHDANRHELLHLLRRTPEDIATEPWDAGIQKAYETAISYLGTFQLAIEAQEPPETIFRRVVLFPTMVEASFIPLVEQQRPRALVILAHYFAYLTKFRHIWWIGDTGPREVRGIESVLPMEWLDLMGWPLQAIEDVYVVN